MPPIVSACGFHPGFYAILDTGYVADSEWESKAGALLDGGARLLQVRAKNRPEAEVRRLVERILPSARKAGVPLIINDHLELAAAIPGAGLHLGQDDGDVRAARRRLGPDRLLGWSTHSLEQALAAISAADVLSYFAVGPVFATGTKPDYPPVGLDLVRQVCALHPPLPFFCIGGINRVNLPQVLATGARGIVAVSDPLLDADTASAVRAYARRVAAGAGA
jgi:thiamine-phosphate pyrophosphorylase